MYQNSKPGYSLIELLLVLAILGVLSGVAYLGVNQLMARADSAGARAELDQIQKALDAYMLTETAPAVEPMTCITDFGASSPALWPTYLRSRYPGGGRAYSWDSEGSVSRCEESVSAATGSYYANRTLSGEPFLVRQDDAIDFDWGYGAPAEGMPENQFSIHWELTMVAPEEGTYCFTTRTDDGVLVFVDGRLVVDGWRYMAATTLEGSINLAAGPHTVIMDYFEGNGHAVAQLDWHLVTEEP